MQWESIFFINSILLGTGLAMDAFSVSIANAMIESTMSRKRECAVASVYAFFQFVMPLTGWILVHTITEKFSLFQRFIPYIALILLSYIGGKMLMEALASAKTEKSAETTTGENSSAQSEQKNDNPVNRISVKTLILQGIATSIDALSAGFTIANYKPAKATCSSLIIALVTFVICMAGLSIGKKAGEKLEKKSNILGGTILIFIGIEIFLDGIF